MGPLPGVAGPVFRSPVGSQYLLRVGEGEAAVTMPLDPSLQRFGRLLAERFAAARGTNPRRN